MSEFIRRRRRPALSCLLCRQRKLRCNREVPCASCAKAQTECVYDSFPRHASLNNELYNRQTAPGNAAGGRPLRPVVCPSPFRAPTSSSTGAYPSPASNGDAEKVQSTVYTSGHETSRIDAGVVRVQPDIEIFSTTMAGDFHVQREHRGSDPPNGVARSMWHKTRLFGQSHWVNSIVEVQTILQLIEPYLAMEGSEFLAKVMKCKSLARLLKAGSMPEWPTTATSDIPCREFCDDLIHAYLQTYESIYRVLHIPTFKRDYEALWTSDADPTFRILLKLVLAIGAATCDEHFSMRTLAIRWMFEAQTWLARPYSTKSRLGIQYLQIQILSHFAAEVTGVGDDIMWTSVGTLYRTAMHMGLHRDPTRLPKSTNYAAEMRRRLWNTILEACLRSSMTSGGPPLISTEDYDTLPPGNYDDDRLSTEDVAPKPGGAFSDTTVAIALRQTFPLRLKIAKFLNDIQSYGTYEETLRLDSEYREAYKSLRQTLQQRDADGVSRVTTFQLRTVDYIMSRHLIALHVPYFSSSLRDKTYAYSRTVITETAFKIWSAAFPTASTISSRPSATEVPSSLQQRDALSQLTISASGFFRLNAQQASILLALDVRAQVEESQESLAPAPLRRDLLTVLDDAKAWHLQVLAAGEPSTKGYLLASLFAAQVDGIMRGLPKEELAKMIVSAGDEAMDLCIPILEEKVRQDQRDNGDDGGVVNWELLAAGLTPGSGAGWDFLTMDGMFDFGDLGATNWDYGPGAMMW